MQTLSKAAEEQVVAAVKRALDLVDDAGQSPDAAFETVARAEKWGTDMVRFAAHAYNTGRQMAQMEESKTATEKFADFPLVDPDKVIAAIWPSTVKTAAEIQQTGVSAEYQQAPGWLAVRAQMAFDARHQADFEKAAADRAVVAPPVVTAETVYNQHLRLKRAAEEARFQAATTYERLLGTMGELADHFKFNKTACFADVEFAVTAYHGGPGQKLMDWVYQRNNMGRGLHKVARAADRTKQAGVIEYDAATAPGNLIEACLQLGREICEKRAAHAVTVAALTKHAAEDMRPFVSRPAVNPIAWSLVASEKSGGVGDEMRATVVSTSTRGLLDKALGQDQDQDKAVDSAWQKLEDPQHEAELQKIRTQALMGDMMNDDVIGSYDPDRVSTAFNEISQMAPRAAQQPMALRTLLRRNLQGHQEPFEVKEVADIEKGIKDTEHAPTPSTRILRDTPDSILG